MGNLVLQVKNKAGLIQEEFLLTIGRPKALTDVFCKEGEMAGFSSPLLSAYKPFTDYGLLSHAVNSVN